MGYQEEPGDRRERAIGGRREDDTGVPMREYVEMLMRGQEMRMELELSNLAAKLDAHTLSCEGSHSEILREIHGLQVHVQNIQSVEDVRRGGQLVLNKGWAVILGAIGAAGSLSAMAILLIDRLG